MPRRLFKFLTAALAGSLLVTLWSADAPAPNRRAHDHLTDHNWQLEIEGVTQGAFAEVSGLDSETEVIEYQDGNDIILRKKPGVKPGGPLRFSADLTKENKGFLKWRKAATRSKKKTRTVKLVLVERVSRRGKARARCTITLRKTRVLVAKVTTVRRGKKKVGRLRVVLKPGTMTHTCGELYKHPKHRKQLKKSTKNKVLKKE